VARRPNPKRGRGLRLQNAEQITVAMAYQKDTMANRPRQITRDEREKTDLPPGRATPRGSPSTLNRVAPSLAIAKSTKGSSTSAHRGCSSNRDAIRRARPQNVRNKEKDSGRGPAGRVFEVEMRRRSPSQSYGSSVVSFLGCVRERERE